MLKTISDIQLLVPYRILPYSYMYLLSDKAIANNDPFGYGKFLLGEGLTNYILDGRGQYLLRGYADFVISYPNNGEQFVAFRAVEHALMFKMRFG